MDPAKDALEALFAGFPAGTVSGAPKVRACEIIAELEPETRGAYAGGVGYFSPDGSMDSCIVLRTAVVKDGVMHVQAGAGIVADSDALEGDAARVRGQGRRAVRGRARGDRPRRREPGSANKAHARWRGPRSNPYFMRGYGSGSCSRPARLRPIGPARPAGGIARTATRRRSFLGYLKVRPICPVCGADNGQHRVDDIASYFTILIVGHIVIAPTLAIPFFWNMPLWASLGIILTGVTGDHAGGAAVHQGRRHRCAGGIQGKSRRASSIASRDDAP